MRRLVLRLFAGTLVACALVALLWAYNTYWKPQPVAVQEQQAAVNSNLTALLEGLPPATPDLTAFPVVIMNCERELRFSAPPQRVIGLWQPSNELLLALGVQERVIGFGGMYDALPPEFAASAREVPQLGSILTLHIPNREQMLKSGPDLIVTEGLDTFAFDSAQGFASVAELEALGAQIYSSGSTCRFQQLAQRRGIEAVYRDLRDLGAIFGVSARAEALVAQLQQRQANIEAAVAGRPAVRVAFFNGDGTTVYVLNGGIWSDLIARAGGQNVFEGVDTAGPISPERFALIDAEVILYGIYPNNGVIPGRRAEQIEAYLRQTFPNIPAVQNNRLYPVSTILTESSVRAIDGLEVIARALHPEAFPVAK